MQARGQADRAAPLARGVDAVVVGDERLADPQPPAVVAADVERVDAVGGGLNEAREPQAEPVARRRHCQVGRRARARPHGGQGVEVRHRVPLALEGLEREPGLGAAGLVRRAEDDLLGGLQQRDPVIARSRRRQADADHAACLDGPDRPLAQRPAASRVVPPDVERARRVPQVHARRAAVLEVHHVHLARLAEAIVARGGADAVVVDHLPERDVVVVEERQRVAAVVPERVAAAVVLAGEVGVGVLVAEVELQPRPAGHQVAPQGVLSPVDVALPRVVVRAQGVAGVARLVAGHHPGLARGCRAVDVVLGPAVDLVEVAVAGLEGEARQLRAGTQQVVVVVPVVDHDGVPVGIVIPEVPRPGLLLAGGRVVDLLAQVPVQGQVMPEPGDQLAVVELPLVAQVAAVQERFVLGLLRLEVQVHAHAVGVGEDDVPLVQPRAVEA